MVAVLLVVAGVVALLRAGRAPTASPATIEVTPASALTDEPVAVTVRDLPADTRTTLTATATDGGGVTWTSTARFQSDEDGEVSLDQPSLGGSYTGIDPMGLFLHMAPPKEERDATVFVGPPGGYDVRLTVAVGRRVVADAAVRRQDGTEAGVTVRELTATDGGIHGTLYLPAATGRRRPAVLVVGDGPARTFDASQLAARGYPSLALTYLDAPGLPRTLENVPLEYFTRALVLLRARAGGGPRKLIMMGTSRGSEAALLVGAHFPELVSGVVAGVPSSVVNPGSPDGARPAWTLRGRPVPAVSPIETGVPTPPNAPEAIIPVERIHGPVLLSCGTQDVVWPSCGYADAIAKRLAGTGFDYAVISLRYPDAGHLVGNLSAYYSITDAALAESGGTVTGTQAGLVDGHAKLLRYLGALG